MKQLNASKLESIEGGGCGVDMGIAFVGMIGSSLLGPAGIITGGIWAYRFISAAQSCE